MNRYKIPLILLLLSLPLTLFGENDPFILTRELFYNYEEEARILDVLDQEYSSAQGPDQVYLDSTYFFLKGQTLERMGEKKQAEKAFQESYDLAKEWVVEEESLEAYRALASAAFGLSSVNGISGIISMADELDSYTDKILELDPQDPFGLLFGSQKLVYAPRLFGGDPEKALETLSRLENRLNALEKPLRFETLYALSYCWDKLKDKEKARNYADRALRLYPRNEELLEWREKI